MSSVYKIQKGDTLWDIAKRVYGDGRMYKKLAVANNLDNPNLIVTGKGLILPDKDFLDNVKVPTRSITSTRPVQKSNNVSSPQGDVVVNNRTIQTTAPSLNGYQYAGSASNGRNTQAYKPANIPSTPKPNSIESVADKFNITNVFNSRPTQRHLDEVDAKRNNFDALSERRKQLYKERSSLIDSIHADIHQKHDKEYGAKMRTINSEIEELNRKLKSKRK